MGIDELLENNATYAASFDKGDLPSPPTKRIAVVTCMDARIDAHRVLGLKEGDAHVIRNAGGLVTEDAIRSLLLSQRVLATEEVMVIQHTGCGMLNLAEADVKEAIERDFGVAVDIDLGAFADLHDSVRNGVSTVKKTPFLTDQVRGFVYDVKTGVLQEVT